MPEPTAKPLSPNGFYLAFDYGQKRLGVAGGQSVTRSANPVEVISVTGGRHWFRIEQLVQEWQPCGLVVGMPCTADGTVTPFIRRVSRFASDMEARFHLPVYRVDERLSSYAARDRCSRIKHRKMRPLDDAAAAVILQTWFDCHDSQP